MSGWDVNKMNGNKPEKKISAGGVVATIWRNQSKGKDGRPVEFRTVSLEKRYKDGNDWKSTNSFGVNDLPKAALVAQEAYKYLVLKEKSDNNSGYSEEAEEEEAIM